MWQCYCSDQCTFLLTSTVFCVYNFHNLRTRGPVNITTKESRMQPKDLGLYYLFGFDFHTQDRVQGVAWFHSLLGTITVGLFFIQSRRKNGGASTSKLISSGGNCIFLSLLVLPINRVSQCSVYSRRPLQIPWVYRGFIYQLGGAQDVLPCPDLAPHLTLARSNLQIMNIYLMTSVIVVFTLRSLKYVRLTRYTMKFIR